MGTSVAMGILIPFLGTSLGAAMVLFVRKAIDDRVRRGLEGFAAGIMVAASIWSLLLPAAEEAEAQGGNPIAAPFIGFWFGILFLLVLDMVIPHLHLNESRPEGLPSRLHKTTMLVLAVTIHNIPEGMAVGVVYAAWLSGATHITEAAAFALALGIAIQNFPEGAIISLPLHGRGVSKGKSLVAGLLSGVVEPIGALITIALTAYIAPVLPYLLSFAAGAMLYVVVEELIPEMSAGKHSNIGVLSFSVGFSLMMVLDQALG